MKEPLGCSSVPHLTMILFSTESFPHFAIVFVTSKETYSFVMQWRIALSTLKGIRSRKSLVVEAFLSNGHHCIP